LALTQVPPDDALVSVVLVPTHTFRPPDVAPGSGLTVTVLVALAEQAPNVAVAVYTNVVGVTTVVGYTYTVFACVPAVYGVVSVELVNRFVTGDHVGVTTAGTPVITTLSIAQ
jgi:hypothetical protein